MALGDRQHPPGSGSGGTAEVHPDAERLAEYVDGVLGPVERTDVERHLVGCADCRAVVAETMAFVRTETSEVGPPASAKVVPFRSRRWVTGGVAVLALAAALVLAAWLARPAWIFGPRTDRPELQELVAAVANEPTRPVEGRLTGGFKYAPPPSPTRGPGDREVSPDVKIAAAKIEKLAREKDTPANQAAFGVACLATSRWDDAVRELERAVSREPTNPRFTSDLAAAYLSRYPPDVRRAIDWARQSIAINPRLAEAWFNLAVAAEHAGEADLARQAWTQFVGLDPASDWGHEARRRLEAPR